MNVVILTAENANPGDLSWDKFTSRFPGIKIYQRTATVKELIERSKDAEAIIAPEVQMTPAVLEKLPRLKYIGTFSTGYNIIDIAWCKEHNVAVSNVPAYGTEMVSEYAIALLLEICCRVGHHSAEVHKGRWSKAERRMFWDYPIIELRDKTMGIIGFGRIGKNTAKIAQALGMNVLYSDKVRSSEYENERCKFSSNEEIYESSDVIMLHCPLFSDTYHLINEEAISKMKDGVILINNARGSLVDENALAGALKSGKIYAAGLDVTETEPISDSSPLLSCPNCFITPHISWCAAECRERQLSTAFDNLVAFVEGNPQNLVF